MEPLEYEIQYSSLNVEKLIMNRQSYDYEIIVAYAKELKKGFKVKKTGKTGRTGTKFTYIKLKDNYDIEEYERHLTDLLRDYNNKYNDKIILDELN